MENKTVHCDLCLKLLSNEIFYLTFGGLPYSDFNYLPGSRDMKGLYALARQDLCYGCYRKVCDFITSIRINKLTVPTNGEPTK